MQKIYKCISYHRGKIIQLQCCFHHKQHSLTKQIILGSYNNYQQHKNEHKSFFDWLKSFKQKFYSVAFFTGAVSLSALTINCDALINNTNHFEKRFFRSVQYGIEQEVKRYDNNHCIFKLNYL